MEKEQISTGQEKRVKELHWEIQQCKSNLHVMGDEIVFIMQLLDSYVFETNTPNLFERLQEYKARLKKTKIAKEEVRNHITKHENTLGAMLECRDNVSNLAYYRKHDKLQAQVDGCMENFQELKSEIFRYAGGILKQRKS